MDALKTSAGKRTPAQAKLIKEAFDGAEKKARPAVANEVAITNLLWLDPEICFLDELAPARGIVANQRGELVGAAACRFDALPGKL